MIRRASARLSYANVVASLALFLALGGGTALALGRNSVDTRELAKQAVKGRNVDPSSLKNKHLADDTVRGNKVNEQTLGPVPHANAPSAHARVRADATVDEPLSRQVGSANVANAGAGVYCFVNLPFTPTHVQVTAGAGGASDRVATAEVASPNTILPNCPAGSQAEVNLHSAGGGTSQNGSFFVELGH